MKLEISNLRKQYGTTVVLDDVNLSLEAIHSLVCIGPSGGGKTTLLRLLAGLELPDKGVIHINQHNLQGNEEQLRTYRKSVGMVFQAYNLFPHLTALENIMLPLVRVQNYAKGEAKETALQLLSRFNLVDHAHKKPSQLSGGQQQRIAICRAVGIKPELLLLDEPTSALDPEFTSEVLDLIEELREDGLDLILVTHEMGFAKTVADHILFIADGSIAANGPPQEIMQTGNYSRVDTFLKKVLKYSAS